MIALLLVVVMGCVPEEPAPEVPPPAPAPPAPEPVEDVAPPVQEAKEVKQKTVVKDIIGSTVADITLVKDLNCDVTDGEGRFEFVLVNPTDDTTWTLRRVSPLESSTDINPLVVTVNGRRFDHTNCDGTNGGDTLGPGDSITCAKGFEPKTAGSSTTDWVIRVGDDDLGKPLHNRLLVNGLDVASEITFKCD